MDLESEFNEAAAAAKNLKNVDTNTMLKLYGLFKQATGGPCNIPKPGFFDFVGKQKWEAWSSLGGMSKNEAMEKYIDLVNSLPREESGAAGTKDRIMGVSVSCMANTDTVMQDEDKTIFDWLKEGRPEKVLNLLNQDRDLLNRADESGMCLVHWAADRGDLPMLESLINQGANINAQDAEGQTALHYAYSCGHELCVDLLLKQGADTGIRDAAGVAPAELAYKDS